MNLIPKACCRTYAVHAGGGASTGAGQGCFGRVLGARPTLRQTKVMDLLQGVRMDRMITYQGVLLTAEAFVFVGQSGRFLTGA